MRDLIFGITGVMGSGKTTLVHNLQKRFLAQNTPLHIIELDDIRRYALWASIEPRHVELRQKLVKAFSLVGQGEHCLLDRHEFGSFLFENEHNLFIYSCIATPVLKLDVKNKIDSITQQDHLDKGMYIAIVWAQLLEEGYEEFINSFVIINSCPDNVLLERYKKIKAISPIDIDDKEVLKRKKLIASFSEKVSLAQSALIPYLVMDNSVEGNIIKDRFERPVNNNSFNVAYDNEIKKIMYKLNVYKHKKDYAPKEKIGFS